MTILWFLLKFLLLNKFMACFEYSLLLFCGYTHTRRIYDISFRLGHKRATPWNEIMVREKAELRRGIIEERRTILSIEDRKNSSRPAHLFLSSTVKLRLDVKNLSLMTTPPGQKTRAQMIFPYYPQHQQKLPRFWLKIQFEFR